MRGDIVAADRSREVRNAARAWRQAGFLSTESLSRVVTLYPDDRRRFGPGFRVLAFVFGSVSVWAMVGLSFVFFKPRGDEPSIYLLWALVLSALTELQRGPWARADAGAESATALIAACMGALAMVAATGGLIAHGVAVRIFAAVAAACVLAAWRWGDASFFLGGAIAGFSLLAQTDHGRACWIVTAALLIPGCLTVSRDGRRPPAYRRGAVIVGAGSVLALYFAVHIWSLDQRLIEELGEFSSASPPPSRLVRTLSIMATAALPAGLLWAGWRRREPLLLYSALLLAGASIATIRLYREVMPLSMALLLVGSACLALALGARRWLRSGNGGERGGFTADPLFDRSNRTEAIKAVVAMASFTPAAQAVSPDRSFEGGGGRFGGGGASGSY